MKKQNEREREKRTREKKNKEQKTMRKRGKRRNQLSNIAMVLGVEVGKTFFSLRRRRENFKPQALQRDFNPSGPFLHWGVIFVLQYKQTLSFLFTFFINLFFTDVKKRLLKIKKKKKKTNKLAEFL